jgi:hypothetical protein
MVAAAGVRLAWRATSPADGHLHLRVVGPDGRTVRVLADGAAAGGSQFAGSWDQRDQAGARVPTGVFWIRAQLGTRLIASKRVTIIR